MTSHAAGYLPSVLEAGQDDFANHTFAKRHDSKVDAPEGNQTELMTRPAPTESIEQAGEEQRRIRLDSQQGAERLQRTRTGNASVPLSAINTAVTQLPLVYRTTPSSHPDTGPSLLFSIGASAVEELGTLSESPVSAGPPLSASSAPRNIPRPSPGLARNLSSFSMTSSVSPGSALPSPYLNAMTDITPLPSPLGSDSTAPWRKAQQDSINRAQHDSPLDSSPPARRSSLPVFNASPPKRKKGYGGLVQEATLANAVAVQENVRMSGDGDAYPRHRSISDFVPEILHNVRPRHVTVGSGDAANLGVQEYHMQREAYLASQRGLVLPQSHTTKQLPTPPASTSSLAEEDEVDEEQPCLEDGSASEFLDIQCGLHHKRHRFRPLRQLGQGTFSKVMLATRQRIPHNPSPEMEAGLDIHKLVAVKIVEHGPAGGADEQRIETSLKREVEMLKSISHPSLVHLKACEYQERRALLVLTYCPGGDLFELASEKRDLLTPAMIQRMFSELVSATRYLHSAWIVHRDIKLENVLVNLPQSALQSVEDPLSYPSPIITLTDLGLSRRIPEPPESPLLTTRCGSEDYAAPEILLGQPYDGRLTDGWALGVLLYALMEGRLPFDAPPGKPDRSRNTHRIARCDWIWCSYGDEDGEWDPSRGKDFEGARICVEGLLKKVRMGRKPLEEIEKLEWVRQGICIPGGLKMPEDGEGDDPL